VVELTLKELDPPPVAHPTSVSHSGFAPAAFEIPRRVLRVDRTRSVT
jgi:hypothetical protein